MLWTPFPFGPYKGKSAPWIAFRDTDWLLWLWERGTLYGPPAREVEIVQARARCIRLKDEWGDDLNAAYIFERDGRFSHLLAVTDAEIHHQPRGALITPHLDLGVLRERADYGKGAYTRLIEDAREYLFPEGGNLTERKTNAFFSDPANFALPVAKSRRVGPSGSKSSAAFRRKKSLA